MLYALKRKGWPVDGMTCHIYPEIGAGVFEWRNLYNDVQVACKKTKAPGDLWVTETNFNLLGFTPSDSQSKSLIRLLSSTLGIDKVKIFWYSWDQSSEIGGLNISENSAAWQEIKSRF